ncbi:MAG TPA: class I SAM-dependent methyltransferase [Rhodopila sp.]|nr:class I SAM-dependent methyltransferase [Rhodopila sp.]
MLSAAVRNLIGRFSPQPSMAERAASTMAPVAMPTEPRPLAPIAGEPDRRPWPPGRLDLVHQLWGAGYIFPGGEIETLRLARPLGASSATSLLMIGVGSGGPASSIARNMGAWITGLETDPSLLTAARALIARSKLAKKITIKPWDPENPAFEAKSHHHCLALEPLLDAQPEPILDGLARALKPGGQLVLTELATAAPLNPADPTVSRWARLERRNPADVPAGIAITRMLGRVGLDVRIAEDISARHMEHAMLGWRVMLRDLRDGKPTHQQAAHLVAEAELWLMRRRLIRSGRLRMMRWHAISRAPVL